MERETSKEGIWMEKVDPERLAQIGSAIDNVAERYPDVLVAEPAIKAGLKQARDAAMRKYKDVTEPDIPKTKVPVDIRDWDGYTR